MSEESSTESARYPIRDQQMRHTAAAMAAESHAGESTPDVARGLYRFLTETTEPDLDAQIAAEVATWDAKGYTQEHDDEHGREHVLVQAMQYAIKRRYAAALALLERAAMTPVREPEPEPTPPAHGLAVGDMLTVEQMQNAPTGLLVADRDGDQWERTDDDTDEPWQSVNQSTKGRGAHYRLDEFEHYRPFTVVAVPVPADLADFEPDDTTPRVGDTVRVREGADHCAGRQLIMVGRRTEGEDDYLATHSGQRAGSGSTGHFGPLSDFELVERAK